MNEPVPSSPIDPAPTGLGSVLDHNISALLKRHKVEERNRSRQERMADAITRFSGSMPSVYLHLGVFGFWIIANKWGPLPKWDPTLVVLAMAASVEAIFLSTFVLITQNRLAAQADKRSDLDLHISLLAEHEITRLITMVTAIADKLDIPESKDPQLNELKKNVSPEAVLDTLEQKKTETR
ncbi:MAG: hypothetical protein K0R17_1072 [Rariglobus sp.]|jgi:uncharacterized membrane protein|nr:hypothetical protein [Rariglobus sp.]